MAANFPFESLCEDLQAHVCACFASTPDAGGVHRLHEVSRKMKRLCEEPYVLSRVSLQHLDIFPWYDQPLHLEQHNAFFQKCCDAGNPEALYRVGLLEYFHFSSDDQRQAKGLQLLAYAAEKGVEKAIQIHGLIQICLGCEDKEKVYQRLSAYIIPLTPSKVIEFYDRWSILRGTLQWTGEAKMRSLRDSYSHEDCKCNGLTSWWFNSHWPGLDEFGVLENMPVSMACRKCLWHEALQVLFRYL